MVFALMVTLTSCKSTTSLTTNYEVKSLAQGQEGTVLFKIYSYGKTVEEATERAKMDAIHAVLFKGIPGSNSEKPLIKDMNILTEKGDYFMTFFGVDDLPTRTRNNKKIRYGAEGAPYRMYVALSTDGSINPADRTKIGDEYKVGVAVSVMFHQLRAKLESDGIVRKFGLN